MEWNACKRRFNLRFFHSQVRRPNFAQEHALGTAQGAHLMVIEYNKTPAPRLCQNTFRMAGKECPGGPFCFNIHIEFGPQLRRRVQKPSDTPKGRGRILLLNEQNATPGNATRNLLYIRGRKDEKPWPEKFVMSRVPSKGDDEIYPRRVFPGSEPLKGCISHCCAQMNSQQTHTVILRRQRRSRPDGYHTRVLSDPARQQLVPLNNKCNCIGIQTVTLN